jgi:hypothetical protein
MEGAWEARPKLEDNIKIYLTEIRYEGMDWIIVDHDRIH